MEDVGNHGNWKGSTVALAIFVIVLLIGTAGLGYLYLQDQSRIQSLSTQITNLQNQLDNLNSRLSNLEGQNSALSNQLSLYEKNFPVLKASYTCNAGMGIAVTLTNVGNQSVVVPASGVRILAPNGTQAFPTPGNHMTFYVFSDNECLGATSPGNQTTVTVPAGGTRYIEVTDTSLAGLGQTGNYILTFANVTTTNNQRVLVSPVWISWTALFPYGIVLGYVSFPASGQEGMVFITNNSPNFVYLDSASLAYGSSSCSVSASPPPSLSQGEGRAWQWWYSNGDPCPNSPASAGESFSGLVALSDGHEIAFNGAFQ